MMTLTMMETAMPSVATMLPLSVPGPPSTFSRALRGDAEVADVAGDEGHVCLDHADDRKIGNGLHGPERL